MTAFYVFLILLLSMVCQLVYSQDSIVDGTETTSPGNTTDQTSTIDTLNTTMTLESTVSSIDESTTVDIDSDGPSKSSSKFRWWLVFVPLFTITVVFGIGVFHYYRRQIPHRRFLQNWRSRYDDTDNIILQLDHPGINNSQWPPRISFA